LQFQLFIRTVAIDILSNDELALQQSVVITWDRWAINCF